MPPLPVIDARTFIKFLESLDFYFVRQKGSHARYKHKDGRAVTVPIHGKESLKRGLLGGMLDDIGVEVSDLLTFLRG
jgi:predicted RNA binding protein YcfA (HicA-like mRNA interferase family)